MKRILVSILLMLSMVAVCAAAAAKVEAPADCKHCGMDRTMFGHSRMLITYADGSRSGTCSINCAAIDMKESKGKTIMSIQVADYNTKKLVDAKRAAWVIGGNKKGVMTPLAKWAFGDRKDADAFIKKYGGTPATYEEALSASEREQADKKTSAPHAGHGSH